MDSTDIYKHLAKKFCLPEWAIFPEVANSTGSASRYADAIAMNMYPSRGLEIVGFEIKCSRSDLATELKKPDKAEAIAKFCERWSLVVPAGLIKDSDVIPATWGVYEVKEDGTVRQKIKAERRQAAPITRQFSAALVRRACEAHNGIDDKEINRRVEERKKIWDQYWEREIEYKTQRMQGELEGLRHEVSAFQEASGIMINQYLDGRELGAALMALRKLGLVGVHGGLVQMKRAAQRIIEIADELDLNPKEGS